MIHSRHLPPLMTSRPTTMRRDRLAEGTTLDTADESGSDNHEAPDYGESKDSESADSDIEDDDL
eukprot:11925710-Heterocapsa_arctica.AAC.1